MEQPRVLDVGALQALIDVARDDGRTVVGPTLRNGAVVHDVISSVDELPRGVHDEQEPGHYRARARGGAALFGYAVGPQSWKPWVFPARELIGSSRSPSTEGAEPPRLLLLGVRGCDLAALGVLDRVLMDRQATDTAYTVRRARVLVVAVTCGSPAGTCFCASMGTGPQPHTGYDVSLTELIDPPEGHRFVARAGSPEGARLLETLDARLATDDDLAEESELVQSATSRMGRTMSTAGLHELLHDHPDSPAWDEVADRCLSCGNCTSVCPTCFCTSVRDHTDLATGTAERWRVWDSCFSTDHSYVHGGPVRATTTARYRQWATHKLASWWDQFGSSGCVGCGRCITWCPVGIDLTAQVERIRALAAADEEA
jgi:ferredoxin